MRNPVKRKFIEANEKSNVTYQTLIDEGKVGEFDHLEDITPNPLEGSGRTGNSDAHDRRGLDPSRNT